MSTQPLINIKSLVKHFQLPGGWLTGERRILHAIDDVSLEIYPGQVFGLVGESGCGKTTLGRCLLRLLEPTSGQIFFDDQNLLSLRKAELQHLRQKMQIVFQNPLSSLSPRFKIFDVVAEPLQTHLHPTHRELEDRVLELIEQVGLGRQHLDRYPHELSGGQCQRVAIARALALNPRLLVLDEPTSALDVSVQAQIINLLEELKRQRGLTYLFISHDLNIVQHISDRISVMYLGKLVETASSEEIFNNPFHPYSQALISAISIPEPGAIRSRILLKGSVPSPITPPTGCRFHTRCLIAQACCSTDEPVLRPVYNGRFVACHFK